MRVNQLLLRIVAVSTIVLADTQLSLKNNEAQCKNEGPLSGNLQCREEGVATGSGHTFTTPKLADNDEREASKFAPWSFPPVCTEVLAHVGDRLCVYTNASFQSGRGISIFTTPKIADEMAALPAFRDHHTSKRKAVSEYSDLWLSKDIPNKGVGLVSKRKLKYGGRITTYTPAFVALLEQALPVQEREVFWRVAIDQLPAATRDMYYKLATVYAKPEVIAQDVVQANNFGLELGGHHHLSVFPETSRINHDCSPNAQYVLDPELLTHTVRATRLIEPDEEITISYTDPLETTSIRQQRLSEGFHFTCKCSRCTSKRTDGALAEIRHMKQLVDTWEAGRNAPVIALSMLNIYNSEGLEGFLDVPYGYLALAWNAVGDAKKSKQYAGKAMKATEIKDGSWASNWQMWKELRDSPQKHWSWQYVQNDKPSKGGTPKLKFYPAPRN